MTCREHATLVDECCGCAGRWDRAMAERAIEAHAIAGIAAATIRAAIAEIDRLVEELGHATAEIEALRCGDLGAFHDGELSPERASAFRDHLARCEACQVGLQDLMIIAAIASTGGSNG